MKFCPRHWDALWREVGDRSLARFCARDQEAAARKVLFDEFDPIVNVLAGIGRQAFAHAGPACLERRPDGGLKCPICVLLEVCQCGRGAKCTVNEWIADAVDEQVGIARERGLLPMPS